MSKVGWWFIYTGIGLYSVMLVVVAWVALSMLFWVHPAHAGERMDNLQSMDTEDYCTVVTDEFLAGVVNQAYGSAREFKHAGPDMVEWMEHGLPLPKDAMYIPEWNDHTEDEQDFIRQHVLEGYDEAAKIGREITDDEATDMARAYYQNCKRVRDGGAALGGVLRRVEALENVAPAKRMSQCNEWLSDHKFVALAVKHGRDCDQMKEWNQTTPGVQDERRAKIARLVNEACAAGRDGVDAWFEKYSKHCMGL